MGCQLNLCGSQHMLWITGNEMSDRLAKRALTKEIVEVQVNVSKVEVKCIIWEKSIKGGKIGGIEGEKGRHLYQIQMKPS